jgi:NADH dehydrogenase
MPPSAPRVLVTGANGNLGRALLATLGEAASRGEAQRPRAAVRSQRAAQQVAALPEHTRPEIVTVDYRDERQMREAAEGCDSVVHLVGIIKEGANTGYEEAHEGSCAVLARAAAAAGARRIVYLSIVGSHPAARNACLASKGRAEAILLEGEVPATLLRVPMVLGRNDYAAAALRGQAQAKRVTLVGGGRTLQQPIDSRDVVCAVIAAAADASGDDAVLELGGPESLAHRDLVSRAARALGREPPSVRTIPLPLARAFASVATALLPNPPITPAMLDVLQHDDRVDPRPACKQLGISLRPLDETLAYCLSDADEKEPQ